MGRCSRTQYRPVRRLTTRAMPTFRFSAEHLYPGQREDRESRSGRDEDRLCDGPNDDDRPCYRSRRRPVRPPVRAVHRSRSYTEQWSSAAHHGGRRQHSGVVRSSFPTSLGIDDAGDVDLAINGVGAPGSGQLVKYSGVVGSGAAPSSTVDVTERTDQTVMEGDHSGNDMAQSDNAESMQSPAMLPTTGASMPNSEFALLVMLGVLSAGTYVFYRRRHSKRSHD